MPYVDFCPHCGLTIDEDEDEEIGAEADLECAACGQPNSSAHVNHHDKYDAWHCSMCGELNEA
ncbi:MAG: hypothetical protein ABL923_14675 [Burkholderiaceae bacterium]